MPDFTHTDAYQVSLTLHGKLQDPLFLQFLEKIGREREAIFSTHDLLVLDLVRRELPVPSVLRSALQTLTDEGIIESVGRGLGIRYFLSRTYYQFAGKRGVFTRKQGLDPETNRQLLLKHIRESGSEFFVNPDEIAVASVV